MTTDTYLLDIAVREVMRINPGFARAMRRKARNPRHPVFGWEAADMRVRIRYASLFITEQDFWASKTAAQAEAAGRRLESLGHPCFLTGSAA